MNNGPIFVIFNSFSYQKQTFVSSMFNLILRSYELETCNLELLSSFYWSDNFPFPFITTVKAKPLFIMPTTSV